MKNIVLITLINLLLLCFFHISFPTASCAQQDWKQEYATVCAETQNATNLSSEVLREYVGRCDKLHERINELKASEGESGKKVYTKRLKMCRDIYKFALDYKSKEE